MSSDEPQRNSEEAPRPPAAAGTGSRSTSLDLTEGSIGKPKLGELLRRISELNFSGVLYLRRGDNRRRAYLTNSALVFASSTVPGERLGDLLLARGGIDGRHLRSLHEQGKVEGRSVLDLLEAEGVLGAAEHGELLCRITEKILCNAGAWTDGEWQLVPGKLPPEVARPSAADQPLWSAMLSSYDDWRKVYETLAEAQTALVMTPDALKQSAYKDLSFAAKQLMSLFSRERTVQQVARGRVMNRFEELLTLARCVELGLLRVTRLARPEDPRPSEIAESESTLPLDRSEITLAAEATAQGTPPGGVPLKVAVARGGPPDGEEMQRRRQRSQELRDQSLEQSRIGRDVQRPLELLQQAMALDPESVDLLVAAAELLVRSPKRHDEAKEYCNRALAVQPANGRVHLVLAKIHIAFRNLDEARKSAELAAADDPGGEAGRLLANLTRPPAKPLAGGAMRAAMLPPRPQSSPSRKGSPAPNSFWRRQRLLTAALAAVLLAAWGYGMYFVVLWRLDANLGPSHEPIVQEAGPR